MTTYATVVLDSGIFLSALPDSGKWDVGYFDSEKSVPSIRVYSDGKEISVSPPLKVPAGNATLEVQLVQGDVVKKGISVDSSIILNGLTWDKLYDDIYSKGEGIEIDESKLDCIIRFHSGEFRASMIKARRFKLDPSPASSTGGEKWIDSVAHNVVVHYEIDDNEELRLVQGDNTIWSTGRHPISASIIEIEFVADHSTATQYFRSCLKHTGPYWLPNQGDPPPSWPPNK